MVCEARTAYSRICDDPDADKFEYPAYIDKQERETRKAYAEVMSGTNPDLEHFKCSKNLYIDTTQMSIDEVFDLAKKKLQELKVL